MRICATLEQTFGVHNYVTFDERGGGSQYKAMGGCKGLKYLVWCFCRKTENEIKS